MSLEYVPSSKGVREVKIEEAKAFYLCVRMIYIVTGGTDRDFRMLNDRYKTSFKLTVSCRIQWTVSVQYPFVTLFVVYIH